MRRVQYEHSGGPEVLEVVSADVPTPGPGELLVRVEAIGVTLPGVRKVREQREPIPLGGEIAGEVVAVGEGVDSYAPGYRVTGVVFGHGYAEYALLSVAMASPIPDGASAVDAVALVRSGLVALGALDAAKPVEGESALVTAAASGVGHLAVQLARVRGAARVVGAVSDPAKADFVRELGADEVVAYDDASWGSPVDYVLDAVGGELLTPALAAVAPGGRLVAYSSGGGAVQAYDLLSGGKSVIGFQIARIAREQPEVYEHWRQELWQYFASGLLRPVVHAEYALEDVATAHTVIEKRTNLGKVVLIP
ncbi:zinc-binding dehydrogenase [Nocardia cyriacigeorgica]|uniref:Zinc-binding dehydrogenase n=1 Tax=Nocardia cyriacigeorgica TaxID=135487 RepID=A0A6P1DB00_9NOCA|nr:zinc-binding dehydrogenase [Nocardia cyriacigeorgica]NEW42314.1 zinc-binding dehydrogenase [Nocardia cyriacigeorgica]NEW47925.1 zinc-binding dehydrogenase [Nocardia cyriacigeorgica]NEW54002.1 zinc-binding dehydrogenase [Nocardia cyriacigeorgica]NEW59415.1 zinc-binding dehydrogenase [Nocardia cyriacigeorgica]